MSVTTEQLSTQIAHITDLRGKEKQAAQAKKVISDELEIEEKKMIELLEAADLKSFKSPFGTAGLSFRTSVRLPQTNEDWELLFSYVKANGLDNIISISSQSLNSLYKDSLAAAIERGETDVTIPGVGPATITPQLSIRK